MRHLIFHWFTLGDVEDPDIYAAIPLGKFMDTDQGQWIRNHCKDPRYSIRPDPHTLGFKVTVYGEVEDKQAVEWILRWGECGSDTNH